ncbi:VOC family protein [Streptomyces sp. NPDC054784]
MPVATLGLAVLDCPDPRALAAFYAGLLGGEVADGRDTDWADLFLPGGARIAFQRAPDFRPPPWPSDGHGAQQMHLDLMVDDIATAQERAFALGAKPLDLEDDAGAREFRVYADPVGHPFCLVRN